MTASAVVFYLFAAITVGSAAVVVLARSLIYSAFALLFTFFGVAGLYVLLGADFLAATQLLIYVGGILVLLLFGVMLTHKLYDLDLRSEVTQFLPAAIIVGGLFLLLAWPIDLSFTLGGQPMRIYGLLFQTHWATGPGRPPAPGAAGADRLRCGLPSRSEA
jgi:NADH:ubiquinone oxidoreductase subunit 6 (subunit J)